MAESAPVVRVDRSYFNEVERTLIYHVLMNAAEMVNAIGKGGTIYPNVILDPQEAAAKRAAMEGRP